jgi:hypothetical protein
MVDENLELRGKLQLMGAGGGAWETCKIFTPYASTL